MKKLLLASAAFVGLAAAPALSADLPSRKSAPIFLPTPVYSWTGFYAGLNAGWGFTDGDGNIRLFAQGFEGTYSGDGNGFVGGAQIGYNYQFGQWVLGVEADIQGSTGDGTVRALVGPFTMNAKAETPWFGTVRGRVGYAFDRYLVYGTGGVLFGRNELSGIISPGGTVFSSSEDYVTYTVGVGVEAALWDRWTAKIEYLYAGTPSDVAQAPGTAALSGDSNTHIVRVGVNYRF